MRLTSIDDSPAGRVAAKRLACVVCGEPFHASRADARTCSDRCRRALSRRLSGDETEVGQAMSQIGGDEDRLTADVVRRHLAAATLYNVLVDAASASHVCPGCDAIDKRQGEYFCGRCMARLPARLRNLRERGWSGLADGLAEAFNVLTPENEATAPAAAAGAVVKGNEP